MTVMRLPSATSDALAPVTASVKPLAGRSTPDVNMSHDAVQRALLSRLERIEAEELRVR